MQAFVKPGDTPIDITLHTLAGKPVTIASLLRTKHLVIETCAFTCDVCQGNIANYTMLANKYSQYAENITFVVVYQIEAHPKAPWPSPYTGIGVLRCLCACVCDCAVFVHVVWERPPVSVYEQDIVYSQRLDHARAFAPKLVCCCPFDLKLAHPELVCVQGPNELLLLDQLTPFGTNNPYVNAVAVGWSSNHVVSVSGARGARLRTARIWFAAKPTVCNG